MNYVTNAKAPGVLQPRKQGHRFIATLLLFSMLVQSCGGGRLSMLDDGETLVAANQHFPPEPSPAQSVAPLSGVLPTALQAIVYDYVGGLTGLKLAIRNENKYKNEGELRACWRALDNAVFDAEKWEKYYGEVGPEPAIPKHLLEFYTQDCRLCPGKKVYDTHLLTLIPQTVNGQPLTLTSFGELIQRPKNGEHGTEYKYYGDDMKQEFGAQPAVASHWALMSRDVVEGSRSKSYAAQRALVEQKAKTLGIGYAPTPILSGVVSTVCHHLVGGERLFSDSPYTYCRASETVSNGKRCALFGYFDAASRLHVSSGSLYPCGVYGMAVFFHEASRGALAGR